MSGLCPIFTFFQWRSQGGQGGAFNPPYDFNLAKNFNFSLKRHNFFAKKFRYRSKIYIFALLHFIRKYENAELRFFYNSRVPTDISQIFGNF